MPNDITITTSPSLNVVPLQNVTLSVTPSANFATTGYLYQWLLGGTAVSGATSSSYKFDASSTTGNYTYSCTVSGLSGTGNFVYAKTSGNMVVTVASDTSIFNRHLPKGANPLKETGYERYMRIRNLGYC